jgi:hypothetical protein
MLMRVHAALFGFILAVTLAGCSKHKDSASGFVPPTNQTRADYLDSIDRAFTRMDGDGDGVIEAGEIPARRGALIKARDADHNGEITREEFVQGGLARFDRLDANHDGVLTSAERRADKSASSGAIGNTAP